MFIAEVSEVTRTNSTELEEAILPRIIEPPGELLSWREVKIKNAFAGFTGVPSVTVFVPLPELVNAPLCTPWIVAGAAVVKIKFRSFPDWVMAKLPAPSEFWKAAVSRMNLAGSKPVMPLLALAIVQM